MTDSSQPTEPQDSQAMVCSADGQTTYVSVVDMEGLRSALASATRPVWVDLPSTDGQPLSALQEAFDLHPLAIEDCMHLGHRAVLDRYGDHLFFLMVSLSPSEPTNLDRAREFQVFLGPDFILTVHAKPTARLTELRERVDRAPHPLSRGPDRLMHSILDHAVDDYFAVTARLEDRLDELQERAFDPDDRSILGILLRVRRQVVELRRQAIALQDVTRPLVECDDPLISQETALHFRDVYDHVVRIYERLEMCRDLATSCMDSHYSAVSNRANDIMKVLSIVATIMLPVTFITSYLGMNLEAVKNISHPLVVWGVHGLMLATTAGLLVWFRRRGWI